jgi:azurin
MPTQFMNKFAPFLFLFLVAAASVARADDKTVQIQATDLMKYDVTAIDAAAGQKITVTLTNVGKIPKVAMAHNFVLLKAGTDVTAFVTAAMTQQANGYMPPDMADKVIAATRLLGPGETDSVTFTAPAAGTYDYVCTFPGHALTGMRGTLTVK